MPFTTPFVPPKKVSFSGDLLLPTLFYDKVVKEEELGRDSFGSTYKARFKGDTDATKEFIRNK